MSDGTNQTGMSMDFSSKADPERRWAVRYQEPDGMVREWRFSSHQAACRRVALLEALFDECREVFKGDGSCLGCGEDCYEVGDHAEGCPLLPLLTWQDPEPVPPVEGEQLALTEEGR